MHRRPKAAWFSNGGRRVRGLRPRMTRGIGNSPVPKDRVCLSHVLVECSLRRGGMPRPPESILLSYLSTRLFLGTAGSLYIPSIAVPYFGTLHAKQGFDRAALG